MPTKLRDVDLLLCYTTYSNPEVRSMNYNICLAQTKNGETFGNFDTLGGDLSGVTSSVFAHLRPTFPAFGRSAVIGKSKL